MACVPLNWAGLRLRNLLIGEVFFSFNDLDRIFVLAESLLERSKRFENILHMLVWGYIRIMTTLHIPSHKREFDRISTAPRD